MKYLILTYYYKPDFCAGSFRSAALTKAMQEDDTIESAIVLTTQPQRYGLQNDFSQLKLFHSVIKDILSQKHHSSTSLFVSENEKEEAKLLLSENGIKGEQYLVCIPGASWRNKTWETDNYLELFKYFMKNKFEIILLGTEKDVICNDCALENNSLINQLN